MEMQVITSTSNPRVKQLVQWKKKRKSRDEDGIFLVEGIRMFREVPVNRLREIYMAESFYKKAEGDICRLTEQAGIRPEILSDTVFSHVSDTKSPQGILCVVEQMRYERQDLLRGCPHLLVLDRLQDPGNVGTILRTAEGAGVTGILMDRECADIYNPKTIRSTMGSIYRMPFYMAEDLGREILFLKEQGICTYAAHLEGSVDYDTVNYRKPCAFLIGNEGNGLRVEIAALADTYIKIPMEGQVESLNAAIASAVLMFEVSRQRRKE